MVLLKLRLDLQSADDVAVDGLETDKPDIDNPGADNLHKRKRKLPLHNVAT